MEEEVIIAVAEEEDEGVRDHGDQVLLVTVLTDRNPRLRNHRTAIVLLLLLCVATLLLAAWQHPFNRILVRGTLRRPCCVGTFGNKKMPPNMNKNGTTTTKQKTKKKEMK